MAAIKAPHCDRASATAAVEVVEHDISARDALRLAEILEDESGPNASLVAAAARFAAYSDGRSE